MEFRTWSFAYGVSHLEFRVSPPRVSPPGASPSFATWSFSARSFATSSFAPRVSHLEFRRQAFRRLGAQASSLLFTLRIVDEVIVQLSRKPDSQAIQGDQRRLVNRAPRSVEHCIWRGRNFE